MKKCVLLILMLLVIPTVFAGNEYGNIISGGKLLIIDVDVKVDGMSSRNLEYGEEISRTAYPESVIEFDIKAMNNHTSLIMEDVEMVVTIDDLDLEEAVNSVDIDEFDDKSMKVQMTLPSDTDDGDYEVVIELEGKQNATVHKVKYLLDLVVEDIPDEEIHTTSCSYEIRTLNNSIKAVEDKLSEIGSYFDPYTECTNELTTCNTGKDLLQTEVDRLKPIEDKFNTCDTDRTNYQDANRNLQNRLNNCTNSITTVYEPKANDAVRKTITWIIIAVVAGALVWFNKDKLRKPSGEAEETDPEVRS